jgi:LPXTG-motif cell wall-anchored protein
MRKAASLLTILATILFFAFALSAPASADPNGPGNNGTVKIVNNGDDPMGADDRDNDPHVCQFHIFGFHFDNTSSGTWQIESWPPTGDRTVVAHGTWTADGTGQWAVAGPALADGHYELDAKQTGAPGGDKNKVFWVKCNAAAAPAAPAAPTTSTPTPTPTAVAGFQSPPTSNAVNGVQTPPNSNAVNGVQTAPNMNAVNGVQGLPSTSTDSTPAIPLAAAGLALMGLGGALLRKTRSTS